MEQAFSSSTFLLVLQISEQVLLVELELVLEASLAQA